MNKVAENLKIKLGFKNVLGVSSTGLAGGGVVIFWKDILGF